MTFCWSFLLGFDSSAADETSCTFSLLVCFWCHENSQLKAVLDWHYQQSTMITQIPWLLHILRDIAFVAWNRPSIFHSPVVQGWAKAPSFGAREPWNPGGRSNEKESKGNEGAGHHETPSSSKVLGTLTAIWMGFCVSVWFVCVSLNICFFNSTKRSLTS